MCVFVFGGFVPVWAPFFILFFNFFIANLQSYSLLQDFYFIFQIFYQKFIQYSQYQRSKIP